MLRLPIGPRVSVWGPLTEVQTGAVVVEGVKAKWVRVARRNEELPSQPSFGDELQAQNQAVLAQTTRRLVKNVVRDRPERDNDF